MASKKGSPQSFKKQRGNVSPPSGRTGLKNYLLSLAKNKTFLISFSITIFIVIVSLGYYMVFGLNREAEPPEIDNEPVSEVEEEPEEEIIVEEPEPVSPYTGLPIIEDELLKRPFAIMMDNHPGARPQYGIQNASYVYEIVAEGGITRLLSIFHNYFEEDIGPIRSVRHYYAYYSRENDAIMAHCGGSSFGMNTLRSAGYDNIDEHIYTSAYYREKSRRAPHNLFTSLDRLIETAEKLNIYRETSIDNYFSFKLNPEEPGEVNEVQIPFDKSNVVTYKWDEENYAYRRMINGSKHIDGMTEEQISVTNIIVQYAEYNFISSVHRDYKITGSGEGLLINNGNSHKIKWSKEGYDKATQYNYEDGSPIMLYPGNTWFHILTPRNQASVK